ncbi:MAG: hypothetical protein OXR73_31920 [Myxococcales bacterium]|nr:hypothetical protein [Myxococcales bacterium]
MAFPLAGESRSSASLRPYRGLDLVLAIKNYAEGAAGVWNAVRPALVALDPTHTGDDDAFCRAYRAGDYAPALQSP